MQEPQTGNFYAGSFFVPGASNHVLIMVKSRTELKSAPELNISFDGGTPSKLIMNNASKARVYYRTVEVKARPIKADVKIFGQNSNGEYLFTEKTFNY